MRGADNLTTFMCRLAGHPGASNLQGLSRPVMGLIYLYLFFNFVNNDQKVVTQIYYQCAISIAIACTYATLTKGCERFRMRLVLIYSTQRTNTATVDRTLTLKTLN